MMGATARTAEHVEAELRQAMAQHAAINPRGWDACKRRDILHQRIDRLIDELAGMRAKVTA